MNFGRIVPQFVVGVSGEKVGLVCISLWEEILATGFTWGSCISPWEEILAIGFIYVCVGGGVYDYAHRRQSLKMWRDFTVIRNDF